MAILIFWLVVLVALGNFADFLLGQTGGRRAKDRLVEFYITMNDNNWKGIFRWAGRAMYEFMSKYLGPPRSIRYFLRVLILSLPASTAIGIYLIVAQANWNWNLIVENIFEIPAVIKFVFPYLIPFWISGYVVDLFSWYFAHRAFSFMRGSTFFGTSLTILSGCFAVYLAMIVNLFILFTAQFILFPIEGLDISIDFLITNIMVAFLTVSYGLSDRYNDIPFIAAVMPILVPYALFAIFLIFCALAASSQRLMQKPLSVILQRAEESSKGVFTLAATAVASLIGMLSAADRVVN